MSSRHFAIRTIRDGTVKIGGLTFRPRDDYGGELDGQRWAFGLYPDYTNKDGEQIAYLWGTEQMYRCVGGQCPKHPDPEVEQCDWPAPNLIDGYFHWDWWAAKP
jgi:hypothetical protein